MFFGLFFKIGEKMFGIGHTEMLLIIGAMLLFFGAKKLPELAKGLGKGIKEFRSEVQLINHEKQE